MKGLINVRCCVSMTGNMYFVHFLVKDAFDVMGRDEFGILCCYQQYQIFEIILWVVRLWQQIFILLYGTFISADTFVIFIIHSDDNILFLIFFMWKKLCNFLTLVALAKF